MTVTKYLILAVTLTAAATYGEKPIDFNRDVRPILSKNCIACHGPDEEARKAKLRLDTFEGATADHDGVRTLVPGNPDQSEMIYRIETDDPDEVMPPPKSEHVLTADEKSTLRRWIKEGGEYQAHWAFQPPEKAALPKNKHADWERTPFDAFILKLLEAEGLKPADEADRIQWLRRVSLDLTGLPPTIEEANAFVNDRSNQAHQAVVERLLASSAYGEHWARMWLDLARYADTKGYEKDQHRDIWRYRDWVINALNNDLPFDQFTTEQLAGDLLPNATIEQQVATAFHRNTMVNDEGGTDNEEFRIAAVKDRVDTTLQVWMGLTMGCAKCHDHKYDPIKQKEYYQFFAFFNQSEDADLANDAPTLKVHYGDLAKLAGIEKQLTKQEAAYAEASKADWPELDTWLASKSELQKNWAVFTPTQTVSQQKSTLTVQPDLSVLASGHMPAKDVYTLTGTLPAGTFSTLRLDALTHPSLGDRHGPGRNPADPNFVLSELIVEKLPADGSAAQALKILSAQADYEQKGWPVKNAFDGNTKTGWAISQQFGKDHLAIFKLETPLEIIAGDQLRITLSQQYGSNLVFGRVRWSAGQVGTEAWTMPDLQTVQLSCLPLDELKTNSRAEVLKTLSGLENTRLSPLLTEIAALKKQWADMNKQTTTVPVMRDKPANQKRVTKVHARGNFLDQTEVVHEGIPAAFGALPTGAPTNRLGVAQWLMDAENPLTARVMVNRIWARLFGIGLVETEEDFGVQGLMPSHPELLDYLAVDFREQGWSMKHLLRTITLSSTYRQSSKATPEQIAKDPRNRLLGRGPRFRLSAETVRDQALAVSGLLTHQVGGKSVMPPQPKGVWKSTYNGGDWNNATGPDRYRRGLYTYLKRTSPYPAMTTFDGGSGEVCQIRRIRTNTPLQALVTLNDPAFVEAAGALAQRMLDSGGTLEKQITTGFQHVLLRRPTEQEVTRLVELYHSLKTEIVDAPAFLTAAGVKTGDAAMVAVANVLLNLDETIMKP